VPSLSLQRHCDGRAAAEPCARGHSFGTCARCNPAGRSARSTGPAHVLVASEVHRTKSDPFLGSKRRYWLNRGALVRRGTALGNRAKTRGHGRRWQARRTSPQRASRGCRPRDPQSAWAGSFRATRSWACHITNEGMRRGGTASIRSWMRMCRHSVHSHDGGAAAAEPCARGRRRPSQHRGNPGGGRSAGSIMRGRRAWRSTYSWVYARIWSPRP
jgi:hypothetical protein